jgi:hypothetical protein
VGLIRGKVSQLQMAAGGWLDKIKRFIPLVYVLLGPFPADGSAKLSSQMAHVCPTAARAHFFIISARPNLLAIFFWQRGWGENTGPFDYNAEKHTQKVSVCS